MTEHNKLYRACLEGDYKQALKIIDKDPESVYIAVFVACKKHDIELINLLYPASWSAHSQTYACAGAALSGNVDLLRSILDGIPPFRQFRQFLPVLNMLIYGTRLPYEIGKLRHVHVGRYLLEKVGVAAENAALIIAVLSGDWNFYNDIPKDNIDSMNEFLSYACEVGLSNIRIIDDIINSGVFPLYGLEGASKMGDIEMAEWLIKRTRRVELLDNEQVRATYIRCINYGLAKAAKHKQIHMIDYLLFKFNDLIDNVMIVVILQWLTYDDEINNFKKYQQYLQFPLQRADIADIFNVVCSAAAHHGSLRILDYIIESNLVPISSLISKLGVAVTSNSPATVYYLLNKLSIPNKHLKLAVTYACIMNTRVHLESHLITGKGDLNDYSVQIAAVLLDHGAPIPLDCELEGKMRKSQLWNPMWDFNYDDAVSQEVHGSLGVWSPTGVIDQQIRVFKAHINELYRDLRTQITNILGYKTFIDRRLDYFQPVPNLPLNVTRTIYDYIPENDLEPQFSILPDDLVANVTSYL
jgi:hypothetical protein